MFKAPTFLFFITVACAYTIFGTVTAASEPERTIEFSSPTFNLGVEQENIEHEWVDFTEEDSNEAIARFGCDDLFCINVIRAQRGQGPLQLEFTPMKLTSENRWQPQ